MSPFVLQPATAEDLPELALIFQLAFEKDPNFSYLSAGTTLDDRVARGTLGYQKEFVKPGRRYFKVVDQENGQTAAFSSWHFPHTYTPEQVAAGEAELKVPTEWTPGTVNVELNEEFFGKLFEGRRKNLVRDDMYFMNVLAVRPEYQRKGLGSMLLEPVLKQADAEGRRTYIEASKMGLGLYLRLGWKEFDELLLDLRPCGGTTVEKTSLMIREPQSGK